LDWPEITSAVEGHPFAEAFLFLLDRLGIADVDLPDPVNTASSSG
jgi:hypothetical protein